MDTPSVLGTAFSSASNGSSILTSDTPAAPNEFIQMLATAASLSRQDNGERPTNSSTQPIKPIKADEPANKMPIDSTSEAAILGAVPTTINILQSLPAESVIETIPANIADSPLVETTVNTDSSTQFTVAETADQLRPQAGRTAFKVSPITTMHLPNPSPAHFLEESPLIESPLQAASNSHPTNIVGNPAEAIDNSTKAFTSQQTDAGKSGARTETAAYHEPTAWISRKDVNATPSPGSSSIIQPEESEETTVSGRQTTSSTSDQAIQANPSSSRGVGSRTSTDVIAGSGTTIMQVLQDPAPTASTAIQAVSTQAATIPNAAGIQQVLPANTQQDVPAATQRTRIAQSPEYEVSRIETSAINLSDGLKIGQVESPRTAREKEPHSPDGNVNKNSVPEQTASVPEASISPSITDARQRSILPATSTSPSADPAVNAPPIDQIVRAAELSVKRGFSDLTVRLDPPDLGTLHVKVSLMGGEISAQVRADSQSTHQMIVANHTEIRDALQQAGIKLSQIHVPDFGASFNQFGHRDQAGQWQQQHNTHGRTVSYNLAEAHLLNLETIYRTDSRALMDSFA